MSVARALENKIIAVIDDDPIVLQSISSFLRSHGVKVSEFKDSTAALLESRFHGAEWDVLITGLEYNNGDGLDFARGLKSKFSRIEIIFLSSEATPDIIASFHSHHFESLSTPVDFQLLANAVIRCLSRNSDRPTPIKQFPFDKNQASLEHQIIGRSPDFVNALHMASRVSKSSANIFIMGESGTGKELFAKFIHQGSDRSKGPFIPINCASIPENLLESELFGHAKGSFTGALFTKVGLFESAQDGTLFLDEIGDLSLPLQSKLLRVLQEKNIKRVGENQYRPINCRIICATHKNLCTEVHAHRFREDLFFRLNVIPIIIPPLRERPEDVLPLAEFFADKYAAENHLPKKHFSKDAIKFILQNKWRGNVRELENSIERAVILSDDTEISIQDFMPKSPGLDDEIDRDDDQYKFRIEENVFSVTFASHLPTLDEVTHKYIEYAIQKNGGAKDRTAKEIGIDRKTLYKRMKPESVETTGPS